MELRCLLFSTEEIGRWRSPMGLLVCVVFLCSPCSIRTTVSSSSLVAFTIDTPVLLDTVTHESVNFVRFADVPVTREVGRPELPVLTCLVALPDSVEPVMSWAGYGQRKYLALPIYPAPLDSIVYDLTPEIAEFFRRNSAAYASDEWWPGEPVRVTGEMRLYDQRFLVVQIFPVSYSASGDSVRTWSGFSVAVIFDSTGAEESKYGLGPFQDMADGSPIAGYHHVERTSATVPGVFRDFDLVEGPERVPEYVILVAAGLDGEWIDDLAEHRADLDGFDVAVVTTDEVMDEFGGSEPALTDVIIRDFAEAMWDWGQPGSTVRPSYLLLVGDHEDADYGGADWFLPTHQILPSNSPGANRICNDSWYAYFNSPGQEYAFPDMMVGRLSVKGADTLETMIQDIISLEQPMTSTPLVDNRRRIARLAGTGAEDEQTHIQYFMNWEPTREWTSSFCDWLGYDFTNSYCGDGRDWTTQDGSQMSSQDWVDACRGTFEDGAGVVLYSNHGDFHFFSAGLEWNPLYCMYQNKGAPDSTFNCIEARSVTAGEYHQPPFVLMLCCSAGTFNHTGALHPQGNAHPEFCLSIFQEHPPYDFGTDCLAEAVSKNTDCPVAGVFAGSLASSITDYAPYGCGILESIYRYGESRLGESIAGAKLRNMDHFFGGGDCLPGLGQFNLLGDPALDIGDRVRYPDKCDLVISPADLSVGNYPRDAGNGFEEDIVVTVRNNGGSESGEFVLRVTVSQGQQEDVVDVNSGGLGAGESGEYQVQWGGSWFSPPGELLVRAEADPSEECDDSWRGNNTAAVRRTINDFYPQDEGWPVMPAGVVGSPPVLADLDEDGDLEIVTISGSLLEARDADGTLLWRDRTIPVQGSAMAADLDEDGSVQLLTTCGTCLAVFDQDGNLLCTQELDWSGHFAVADMDPTEGLELVTAEGSTLHLYSWDAENDEFDQIDSVQFTLDCEPGAMSLACADLNDDGYCETVYYCSHSGVSGFPPSPSFCSLLVRDWVAASNTSERTVEAAGPGPVALCAGLLAGDAVIGFPLGSYGCGSSDPAQLLDPLGGSTPPTACDQGDTDASCVRWGVFADWDPFVEGPDAFIIPAENQCLAWNSGGGALDDWSIDFEDGPYEAIGVTSPALADLDEDGSPEILLSTFNAESGSILCLSSLAASPLGLGFPYTLPSGVFVTSGFSVADIDEDEAPEIVFGTSDGLLHCWQVGECSEGYAPWVQDRHDAGRTGVLP